MLLAGQRSVKPLAPKKGSRGSADVTVPAGVASGSFLLLACADDLRKVKERREANNCRASSGRVSVVSGPGSQAPPTPPPPTPPPPPDTTPPPTPTIDSTPEDPTNAITATFTFSNTEAGVSFRCRLDAGGFVACTSPATYSELAVDVHTFAVKARDPAGNESAPATFTWTIDTLEAPPLDPTVPTNMLDATSFLYEGDDPVQTGVAPGTIQPQRAAVVRGKVIGRDDHPIPGVEITMLDHPELGRTATRANGLFDIAVNGGGPLAVVYEKDGFIPVQREVDVSWQDFTLVDDVVMIGYDSAVTEVRLDEIDGFKVAQGTVQTDADGSRQATMLFPEGVGAEMRLPDGSTVPLDTLHVRATEYTVGESGDEAMPAELPPTSGYTYAVELSVDEAVAAGATSVEFDGPVPFYVENFLDFPAGSAAPVGYFDRERGDWVAAENGRVIEIVSESDGKANLDMHADDEPETADDYASLGISDAERERLATLYEPGDSLWRVAVRHFSPHDLNWLWRSIPRDDSEESDPDPEDPLDPDVPDPEFGSDADRDDDCETNGSVIGCENRTLGESVGLVGTPFSLHYSSDRVPGRQAGHELRIPVLGANVPPGLKRVEVVTHVAGKETFRTLSPTPNLSLKVNWDGKDLHGRPWEGSASAYTGIQYFYATYRASQIDEVRSGARHVSAMRAFFGRAAAQAAAMYDDPAVAAYVLSLTETFAARARQDAETRAGELARHETAVLREWQTPLAEGRGAKAGAWDARSAGLAGWTLDVHHTYDASSRTLYLGDGSRRSGAGLRQAMTTVAGTGTCGFSGDGGDALDAELCGSRAVAAAADGTLYVADGGQFEVGFGGRVRKITPGGIITTVAGTGDCADFAGGIPATAASLCAIKDLDLADDGTLYVAEERAVWQFSVGGAIRRAAGSGEFGNSGDGGPATSAQFEEIAGIDVAPDGSLYVIDRQADRLRHVGTDGIILTIAGRNCGSDGDGGRAHAARFCEPKDVLALRDGTLYVADGESARLRKITPDGTIYREASLGAVKLALGRDGSVYGAGTYAGESVILRMQQDGTVVPTVGGGSFGEPEEGGPPTQPISTRGVAVGPDGTIYFTDGDTVKKVASPLSGFENRPVSIPSADGSQLFQFDQKGRHQRTLDALTGAVVYAFGYDGSGRLTSVSDRDGDVTGIERGTDGGPTAIVAPDGRRTELVRDANGFLASAENPADETTQFTYTPTGLMTSETRPGGHRSDFSHNALGQLVSDDHGGGNVKTLSSAETADATVVTVRTGVGRETRYEVQRSDDGTVTRSVTVPGGATTTTVVDQGGVTLVTYPSGEKATYKPGPDPRFAMLAPYTKSLVLESADGTRTRELRERRTAVMANDDPIAGLVSLTTKWTVNGKESTDVYDAASRTSTATSAAGRVSSRHFDVKGRIDRIEPGSGLAPVLLTYELRGLPSMASQGGQSWTYTYDSLGRVTSREDAAGHETTYAYDLADRPTSVTLPSGRAHGFAYDADGKLVEVRTPSGAEHTLTYTATGLPASYTPPGGAPYENTYDVDGLRTAVELPSGAMQTFTRDAGGRLTGIDDPDGATSFTYADSTPWASGIARTLDGRPVQDLARPYASGVQTAADFTGPADGTFAYSYDDEFRLAGVGLDGGAEVALTRDPDGLLTQYGPFDFARGGPAGDPTSIGDGVLAIAFTYDSLGRVATRTQTVAGTEVYSVAFTYDAAGRITRRVETVAGVANTYDYAYDADGRLTRVDRAGDALPVELYTYDLNGNRLTVGAEAATYDGQDRLTQRGTTAYGFDADGFLASRGSDMFDYSRRGELLGATVGGQTVNYAYDGFGRRVARTDSSGTSQFLYGNPDVPYQLTASRKAGTLTRYFYDEGGRLFAFHRGPSRYYVGADQVGTPKVVTNAAGTVVKTLEYDSFGRLIADSDPTFELLIGFAGGIHDPLTGLIRFGARDYEPESGRWTARDQALFAGRQANLYAYVNSNPVSLYDPYGLVSVEGAAYGGVGLEGKLSITLDGISVCGGAGFGIGGGVTVDPFGELDKTGTKLIAEASSSAGIGPVGVSGGIKNTLDDCGNLLTEAKVCVGPLCAKGEKDYLSGESTIGGEVSGEELTQNLKESFKSSGAKAQAKVSGQICFAFKW